jgi:hypothetical protein
MKRTLPVLTALLLAVTAAPACQDQAPKKAGGEVLTPEGLGEMLNDLGLEPKAAGKNKDIYDVAIEKENWKVFIRVSLSGDRKIVWLDSSTKVLTDPEAAKPAVWRKLLELNDEIIPARFSYDKKFKQIHLMRPLDNQGITPARMRQEIDAFDALMRRTEPAWNPKNFGGAKE